MALSKKLKDKIENLIVESIRNRFKKYQPEPSSMPFHTRLLGKDRLALYSFIHSLNTNFGTTIFEPLAVLIASNSFKVAKRQVKLGNKICSDAQLEIQKIMDDLSTAKKSPNKKEEINIIRKVCRKGEVKEIKPTKVDIYLENPGKDIFLIDLKTAKPNKGSFKEFKRTLLEWSAIKMFENSEIEVHSLIAIPYNPYEPEPYSRWTMAGMIDINNELKVAEEFWDFLGGVGTYEDILNCFESAGLSLKDEIDDYFSKFK